MISISEQGEARVRHVANNLSGSFLGPERISGLLKRIENIGDEKAEDASWLLMSLESYCEARAITAWFQDGELSCLKNWLYAKAKIYFIRNIPPHYNGPVRSALEYVWLALPVLVSGHPGMVAWLSGIGTGAKQFRTADVDNPKTIDFFVKQFFLALRGEWEPLRERCKQVLADPPKSGLGRGHLIDQSFFLALANGDVPEMTLPLTQLVSPRQINAQRGIETGHTEDLISTKAILYSIFARRHGHPVAFDSPYVPNEWLDCEPLPRYEDPFEFMKDYEI
jgi:hypothetical protein